MAGSQSGKSEQVQTIPVITVPYLAFGSVTAVVGCISWRCLCMVTMAGGVRIGQHRFLVYGGAGKLLRTSTVLSAFFFFF